MEGLMNKIQRILAIAFIQLGALAGAGVPHSSSIARAMPSAGIESLYQSLIDLSSPWTVMCVAAHPDDEDGETLTYLRKKFGIRTHTLLSTRGEGGQNAVGPELYEELGVIRAHESAAAAAIQGTEVHCLNLRDFGFSKSGDEAMKIWGHDEALRRMVLKIRRLRPDIIITNHDTSTGHGQHQATGRLVVEAFSAAADPAKFPDQLGQQGGVWQVKRLFVRAPRQSKTADVSFDTNQTDPVLGRSYAEIALEALHQHASQGPWPQRIPPEPRTTRYMLAKHESPDLAGGPIPFVGGLQDPATESFLLPEKETTALIFRRKELLGRLLENQKRLAASLKSSAQTGETNTRQHLLKLWNDFNEAIRETAGLQIEAIPDDSVAVRDQRVKVRLVLRNRGKIPVEIGDAPVFQYRDPRFQAASTPAVRMSPLAPQEFRESSFELSIPPDAELTLPESSALYSPEYLQPFGVFHFKWKAEGAEEPADSVVPLVIDVARETEVSVKPDRHFVTAGRQGRIAPLGVTVRIRNRAKKPLGGLVELAGKGRLKYLVLLSFNSIGEDEEHVLRGEFPARVARSLNAISASVTDRSQRVLARQDVELHEASIRTRPLLRVGYIRSFDDTLRDALDELGVRAEPLTVADIQTRELKSFTTIIVDIRGYFAHPELVKLNSRLLAFAKNGGTLIVFYHKTNEWNADAGFPELAPYPIHVANARITDEDAPVKFLLPSHPLLNSPNRITPADFEGWRQERGLYFPDKWDERFRALLSSSDPGEKPLDGGYLVASYGRGAYIHTSYVWYRQLRELNAGAFRIFANMISYRPAGPKR